MARGKGGKNLGTARGQVEIDVSSARKAVLLVSQDLTKLRGNAQDVAKALAAMGASGGGGLGKVKTEAELAADRMNRLRTNIGTVSSALGTLSLPLLAAGTAAGVMGARFDEQLRNVNSIARLSEEALGDLGQQFVDLSRDASKTREGATSLAAGFYQVQSSGFAGAEAMTVLEASTKAASAGMTDTTTVATTTTAILNAYSLGAGEATRVTDTLFQTVNVGVVTFPELAAAIGRVIPTAASANVSIEEVGAAIATMTKSGLSGGQAVTDLNSLLNAVIKPSVEAKDAARALGLDFSLTALQAKGLAGFLADVQAKTGGNADAIAKLVGSQEGLTAALSLTKGEMAAFNSDLEAMGAAAGATDAAFQEMGKSTTAQLAAASAKLEALAIKVGSALLPKVNAALDAVTELFDAFLDMPDDEQQFWIDLALAIGAVTIALYATTKAVQGVMAVVDAARAAYTLLASGINSVSAAWAANKTALLGHMGLLAVAGITLAAAIKLYNDYQSALDRGAARLNANAKSVQSATRAQEEFNRAQQEGIVTAATIKLQEQLNAEIKKREQFLRDAAEEQAKLKGLADIQKFNPFGASDEQLLAQVGENYKVINDQTRIADANIAEYTRRIQAAIQADRERAAAQRESAFSLEQNVIAQLDQERVAAKQEETNVRLRSTYDEVNRAITRYAQANGLTVIQTDELRKQAIASLPVFDQQSRAQREAALAAADAQGGFAGLGAMMGRVRDAAALLDPALKGVNEFLQQDRTAAAAAEQERLAQAALVAATAFNEQEAAVLLAAGVFDGDLRKAIEDAIGGEGDLAVLTDEATAALQRQIGKIFELISARQIETKLATGGQLSNVELYQSSLNAITGLESQRAAHIALVEKQIELARKEGDQAAVASFQEQLRIFQQGKDVYTESINEQKRVLTSLNPEVEAAGLAYTYLNKIAGDAILGVNGSLENMGATLNNLPATKDITLFTNASAEVLALQEVSDTVVNIPTGATVAITDNAGNVISDMQAATDLVTNFPKGAHTELTTTAVEVNGQVLTLTQSVTNLPDGRQIIITTNADEAARKIALAKQVAEGIQRRYEVYIDAKVHKMLLRQSPAPIEQVLDNVRKGATANIDVRGVENMQKLVDLTGRLTTLSPTLGNVGTGRGAGASLSALFATLRTASELAAADADVFSEETAKATSTYLDTAGKAFDVIGKGSENLTKLNDVKLPPREALTGFFYTVRDAIADAGARARENDDDVGELTTLWLDTSSKAVDLIGKGADSFTKLQDFTAPPRENLLAFSFAVRDAVADAAARARENETDLGALTDKWLETAGKTVDVLGKGADAFTKLSSDEFKVPAREGLTKFFFAIRDAVADAAARARENAGDLDELTTAWLETSGKAVALLAQGADGFNKINRGIVVNERALVVFFDAAERAVILAAERARRLDPEAVEAAAVLSEALGKILGPISTGADAFEAVNELEFGKAFIPKLERVFRVMEYAIQLTIAMAARLNSEGVAAAAAVGEASSTMFGGLNDALSFMQSLAEGKLATVEQMNGFAGAFFAMVAVAQGMAARSADIASAGLSIYDNITAGVNAIRAGFTDLANLNGLGVSIQAAISASLTQGAAVGGALPPPPPAVAAVGIPPTAGAGLGTPPGPPREALGGGARGGDYYDQRQYNMPTTVNTPIDLRQLLAELRELVAEEQGGML